MSSFLSHAAYIYTSSIPKEQTTTDSSQQYPPTQPPSHKPPHLRKTQLHRQYTSLLQSSPLLLIFQHNNLRANEWAAIRRELALVLAKASAAATAQSSALGVTPGSHAAAAQDPTLEPEANARLQIITTNVFEAALRTIEHYKPPSQEASTDGRPVPAHQQHAHTPLHNLSSAAHKAGLHPPGKSNTPRKKRTTLSGLLSGPIAVLAFPSLAPAHLAAALRILAPTSGARSEFAAPRRKDAPGMYENITQAGLQKLMLLGARVEGRERAVDMEGVKYVAGLASRGGLEGLRGEVVALLQGAGMGLVGSLESVGMGVWGTLESRRMDMEGGEKGEE